MKTIKDVAHKAGVSTATVSRCLNNTGYVSEQTKKKILDATQNLGFTARKYKKQSVKKNSKGIIGVIIPQFNSFFYDVISGIKKVIEQQGMSVIICESEERTDKEIQYLEMLKNIACGLIVVPTSQTADYNAELMIELDKKTLPIVLLDRDLSSGLLDGVFIDGFHGAYEAVQELIRNGHKDIAIISGPTTCKPGLDRLNGYIEALKDNHLPIKEEYIFYGDFQSKSAYTLTNKLLGMKKRITAIFSANLVMAYGCLKAIDENNLSIPGDIAFMTFDDDLFFNFAKFNISCINNPGYQAGEEASSMLIKRISIGKRIKNTSTCRIVLTPRLILRGSEKYIQ
jgi:LacI family transcriptional regulator